MDILSFLSDLAQNPIKQLQFAQNPAEFARASGLSEAVVEVLASRDSSRLRALMASSHDHAFIYSAENSVIYSTETNMIYSAENSMIYTAETAFIYTAQAA